MKTYLTYTFILAFSAMSFTMLAQNKTDKIYQKFEDAENVFAFTFNKDLQNVLDSQFDWDNDEKYIEGDISKIKTILIGNSSNSTKILKEIHKMLRSAGLNKIEIPKEERENKNMFMYAEGKNGHYSQIHTLIIGDDSESGIMISIYGEITVKEVK